MNLQVEQISVKIRYRNSKIYRNSDVIVNALLLVLNWFIRVAERLEI